MRTAGQLVLHPALSSWFWHVLVVDLGQDFPSLSLGSFLCKMRCRMAIRVLCGIDRENARHLQIVKPYLKKKNPQRIPQIQSPLVQAKVLPRVVLSGIAVGCVPSDRSNPLIHTHGSLDLLKDRSFTLSY